MPELRDDRSLGTGTLNRLSGARDEEEPESDGGVYDDESELDELLDEDEEEDDEEDDDDEDGGAGGGEESGTGTMNRSCAGLRLQNKAQPAIVHANVKPRGAEESLGEKKVKLMGEVRIEFERRASPTRNARLLPGRR